MCVGRVAVLARYRNVPYIGLQHADRVHVHPPASGEGHIFEKGVGVLGPDDDMPTVVPSQASVEGRCRADEVHPRQA